MLMEALKGRSGYLSLWQCLIFLFGKFHLLRNANLCNYWEQYISNQTIRDILINVCLLFDQQEVCKWVYSLSRKGEVKICFFKHNAEVTHPAIIRWWNVFPKYVRTTFQKMLLLGLWTIVRVVATPVRASQSNPIDLKTLFSWCFYLNDLKQFKF